MEQDSENIDDDWLFNGPFIAFCIIGFFTGGAVGLEMGGTLLMVIGAILGGVVGYYVGEFLGQTLYQFFSKNETASPNQNHQTKTSSKASDSGHSQKKADENRRTNESKYSQENAKKQATPPKSDIYEKYYILLESRPQDDFNTIKNNYRHLVRQYHPDHLGLNASEAMHKYAKEMSQKLNEAYEIIKKQRGIK